MQRRPLVEGAVLATHWESKEYQDRMMEKVDENWDYLYDDMERNVWSWGGLSVFGFCHNGK